MTIERTPQDIADPNANKRQELQRELWRIENSYNTIGATPEKVARAQELLAAIKQLS